jgi:hypothetical protein
MKIQYEVTLDDAVAALKHYLQTSPLQRRTMLWGWVFAAIVFGLFGLAAFLSLSVRPLIWGGVWLVAYTMIGLVQRATRDRRLRRIYEEGQNRSLLGCHELELTAEGLAGTTAVSEGRVSWSGIERVVSTETHTFVYTGSGSALIIPQATVTEGDYRAFVAELREYFERARSSHTSVPSSEVLQSGQVSMPRVTSATPAPLLAGEPCSPAGCGFPSPSHSGFGIASFVLALMLFLVDAVLFVAALAERHTSTPGDKVRGPLMIAFAFGLLSTAVLSIVGLAVGVAGLTQRERNRVFAVLGVCCNALLLLGVIGVLLLGIRAQE